MKRIRTNIVRVYLYHEEEYLYEGLLLAFPVVAAVLVCQLLGYPVPLRHILHHHHTIEYFLF